MSEACTQRSQREWGEDRWGRGQTRGPAAGGQRGIQSRSFRISVRPSGAGNSVLAPRRCPRLAPPLISRWHRIPHRAFLRLDLGQSGTVLEFHDLIAQ